MPWPIWRQLQIGLCATAAAKLIGPLAIIAVNRLKERLDVTRRFKLEAAYDLFANQRNEDLRGGDHTTKDEPA
jgi:threonine dehydrogenase-like Zn-dependent dehydrogenase